MSEQKERVSDYRVICYGDPKVSSIVPKSGPNAGHEVKVLTVRGYHLVSEKQADGSFKQKDSIWHDLKLFNQNADLVSTLIKDGMAIRVSGSLQAHTFTGKDGKEYHNSVLTLNSLSVDLMQRGLKSLDFEKPTKKVEKVAPSQGIER